MNIQNRMDSSLMMDRAVRKERQKLRSHTKSYRVSGQGADNSKLYDKLISKNQDADKTGTDMLVKRSRYYSISEISKEVSKKAEELLKEKDIDKEKDLKSSNVGKYAKLYEQNIGLINGVAYEWIINISEEIDLKLFKKAIEIATDKGKCNKGYIGGIIRQWLNNNIKTYDDLKA